MKIVLSLQTPRNTRHPKGSSDHTGKTPALESHLEFGNNYNHVCKCVSVHACVCVKTEPKQIQNEGLKAS